jgi:hypothetical protein
LQVKHKQFNLEKKNQTRHLGFIIELNIAHPVQGRRHGVFKEIVRLRAASLEKADAVLGVAALQA